MMSDQNNRNSHKSWMKMKDSQYKMWAKLLCWLEVWRDVTVWMIQILCNWKVLMMYEGEYYYLHLLHIFTSWYVCLCLFDIWMEWKGKGSGDNMQQRSKKRWGSRSRMKTKEKEIVCERKTDRHVQPCQLTLSYSCLFASVAAITPSAGRSEVNQNCPPILPLYLVILPACILF